MKTRRALQMIVGVLSLLVVLCLVAAAIGVALVVLFPNMSSIATELYEMFTNSFKVIANYMGLAGLSFLVPVMFYVLPCVLLLVAGILMFLRDKGKQGKYVAGNVLALVGIAIITIFTILFAADLVSRVNGDTHVWLVGKFSWTSMEMIARFICVGVLAVFVLFVGLALGLKPKKVETETTQETEQTETNEEAPPLPYETVAPTSEQQVTDNESTTEYVPSDTTVSDVTKGAYGTRDVQLSPTAIGKIKKARTLYEMGALTNEEYIKLVNVYLKK